MTEPNKEKDPITLHLNGHFREKKGWRFKLENGYTNADLYKDLFQKSIYFKKLDDVHDYLANNIDIEKSDIHLNIKCLCLGRRLQMYHNYLGAITGSVSRFSPIKMFILDAMNSAGCYRDATIRASESFEDIYKSYKQLIEKDEWSFTKELYSLLPIENIKALGKALKSTPKRLFPSQETKALLGALEEARYELNKKNIKEFDEIYTTIKKGVIKNPNATIEAMQMQDRSPRVLIYNMIAKMAANRLECGQYHLYRGLLSPIGQNYIPIFDIAIEELLKIGELTDKEAKEEKKALMENIKAVG